jgi:hypothetical protein
VSAKQWIGRGALAPQFLHHVGQPVRAAGRRTDLLGSRFTVGMDLKERPHLYRVMRALTRSAYYKVAGTRFVIDARFIVMQITNSAV